MDTKILLFLLGAAALPACAMATNPDCHELLCSPDHSGDQPAPVEPGLDPTLASLEKFVFVPKCNGCHQSQCTSVTTPNLWLDTEDATIATAVNVTAKGTVNGYPMLRIKPGDRYQSFLFLKIVGAPGMSQPTLTQAAGITFTPEEVNAIGDWIDAGALP